MKKILILVSIFSVFLLYGCNEGTNGNKITVSGTIESTEVNVASETAGKIDAVKVEEGDLVKDKQLLVALENKSAEFMVNQARAALNAAKAKADEVSKGSRSQQIKQAQAQVQQFIAMRDGADKAMKNSLDLKDALEKAVTQGNATSIDILKAEGQYQVALAQYKAYDAQVKAFKEQVSLLKVGATNEAIEAVNAGVEQAKAALDAANYQLSRYRVVSPSEGTIIGVNVNPGEWVNPGASMITISDLNKLWITIYIPEKEIGKIKLGQKVNVKIDSFPNENFIGKITKVANEAEFTPKNVQTKEERVKTVFAVKVSLEKTNGKLKPGMPADVEIAY